MSDPITNQDMWDMADPDRNLGIYGKYRVERMGGTPGKHDKCFYYVLDVEHDTFALPALRAYADACRDTFPALAADIDKLTGERFGEGWPEGGGHDR